MCTSAAALYVLCALALAGHMHLARCIDIDVDPVRVRVVNLTHPRDSNSLHVAVFAAAGLANKHASGGGAGVYVLRDDDPTSGGALGPAVPSRTAFWLAELVASSPGVRIEHVLPLDFLKEQALRHGVVVCDLDREPSVFPAVLTLAGVLEGIPVDARLLASPAFAGVAVPLKLNTTGMWSTAEEATMYAAGTALQNTTALCINSLDDMLSGKLVDWIINQKLFVAGLPEHVCVPGSRDHQLMKGILANSSWQRPVRVYGYNHQDGAVYEAETNCFNELAALISGGTANLPFWASYEPLSPTEAFVQPVQPRVAFNTSKTYIAFLMSDMDNMDFVQGDGFRAMQQRVQLCGTGSAPCFPLTWTLQPNTASLSPAMLRWYYAEARKTGQDWFVLPPSGALYAYPSEFPPDLQATYVGMTNAAATRLNTSASTDWEFLATWTNALKSYFPRYLHTPSTGTGVKLFLLNQVPYMMPMPEMPDTSTVLGDPASADSVVLVHPPFDVATGGTWDKQAKGLLPADVAAEISRVRKGTVTYLYCITGTSVPMAALKDMVALLDEHVQVVGYQQLAALARQRAQLQPYLNTQPPAGK